MNELLTIFNKILAAKKKKELTELRPELHLRNDLGFTSFDLAELTVKIEMLYDTDIFEDGIVYTVGDIQRKLFKEPV